MTDPATYQTDPKWAAELRRHRMVEVPRPSDWQLRINAHTVWCPQAGDEPNAFCRLMARLLLGVRWERVK